MDLKSKVSEKSPMKPCTLRMGFWRERVPSLKMYLKFKLDFFISTNYFMENIILIILIVCVLPSFLITRNTIQWKLSHSGRNRKDWYYQTCQTNLTAFLSKCILSRISWTLLGCRFFHPLQHWRTFTADFTVFFLRSTFAFADIPFLGFWQAP